MTVDEIAELDYVPAVATELILEEGGTVLWLIPEEFSCYIAAQRRAILSDYAGNPQERESRMGALTKAATGYLWNCRYFEQHPQEFLAMARYTSFLFHPATPADADAALSAALEAVREQELREQSLGKGKWKSLLWPEQSRQALRMAFNRALADRTLYLTTLEVYGNGDFAARPSDCTDYAAIVCASEQPHIVPDWLA